MLKKRRPDHPGRGAAGAGGLRRVERHREDGTGTASFSGGAARVATASGARGNRKPDKGPGDPARKGADVSMADLRMITDAGRGNGRERWARWAARQRPGRSW
jgi:hypothetical protein